jgi:hypothetical protein
MERSPTPQRWMIGTMVHAPEPTIILVSKMPCTSLEVAGAEPTMDFERTSVASLDRSEPRSTAR